MPYLNKRNRFVQAAKTFAESCDPVKYTFTKSELLSVSQSIGMKGIPTWVLKDFKSQQKGVYDLAGLFTTTTATV
jgi:hypothetical protein